MRSRVLSCVRQEATVLEGFWSQAPHVPRHVRDALCKGASFPSPGAASSARPWPVLQVREAASASFPSLLSHLTSMYLNTPVLALPVARRQAPGPALRSFHPLASSLPCDFHLLNLRTLQAEVSVRFSAGSSEWTLPLIQTPLHPTLPSWQRCCPTCEPCRDPSPPPRPHTHTHAHTHALPRVSVTRRMACPRQKPRSSYTARVLTVALRPRTWVSTAPPAKAR